MDINKQKKINQLLFSAHNTISEAVNMISSEVGDTYYLSARQLSSVNNIINSCNRKLNIQASDDNSKNIRANKKRKEMNREKSK